MGRMDFLLTIIELLFFSKSKITVTGITRKSLESIRQFYHFKLTTRAIRYVGQTYGPTTIIEKLHFQKYFKRQNMQNCHNLLNAKKVFFCIISYL